MMLTSSSLLISWSMGRHTDSPHHYMCCFQSAESGLVTMHNLFRCWLLPLSCLCRRKNFDNKLLISLLHLVLSLVPPPQVAVQEVHKPQEPTLQSTKTVKLEFSFFSLPICSLPGTLQGKLQFRVSGTGPKTWLANRKVFAGSESFCEEHWKFSEVFRQLERLWRSWKVSWRPRFGQSGKFLDSLKNYSDTLECSWESGMFPNRLECFRPVWNVSRKSRKFLDSP